MKIIPSTLFCILLISGFSCKKKETPSSGITTNNSFTLKKNGVSYSSGYVLVTIPDTTEYIRFNAHKSSNQINIETYSMVISRNIQPGIYDESNSAISLNSICAFMNIHNQNQFFLMDDGEVSVISNDTIAKKIEFDFKFELYDDMNSETATITEGYAKISY